MTKQNIVIIGAGQLGSRHLQALALCDSSYIITVVDPFQASLDVAAARYEEVRTTSSPEIKLTTDINKVPDVIFTAIIATNSLIRRHIIESLLSISAVKFLVLEKFLFPSIEDYTAIQLLLQEKSVSTFVNTPRRMYTYYQDLKKELRPPLHFQMSGHNWGLACNSIHFLDAFCYLTDNDEIELKGVLDHEIILSKRSGYIEFNGTLLANTNNGSTCIISCFKNGDRLPLITITDANRSILIQEAGKGFIQRTSFSDNNTVIATEEISLPRQSELTALVIKSLASTGSCILPTYDSSMKIHLKVLTVFLEKYSQITETNQTLCPIT